ncbi:MAG: pseudouridine synthase [Gemmatimonadaceae bacterium]
MRIQRALARAGIASRRKAEALVSAGRVFVNDAVAQIGQVVDPEHDRLTVDGTAIDIQAGEAVWFALNKPTGTMTTKRDTRGRPTVFAHVPDVPGLTYVGRLDYDTEGLLLMTTDGTAAHALTHPSREVERVYEATVTGDAPRAAKQALQGVALDDGPVRLVSARARREPGSDRWIFEVALTEGRKREVRRLCKALGLYVKGLKRTRFGPIRLDALPVGEYRELSARERFAIQKVVEQREDGRSVSKG